MKPFYTAGNGGPERLNHLPPATQPASRWALYTFLLASGPELGSQVISRMFWLLSLLDSDTDLID